MCGCFVEKCVVYNGVCVRCRMTPEEHHKWRYASTDERRFISSIVEWRRKTNPVIIKCYTQDCSNEADPAITLISPWGDICYCEKCEQILIDIYAEEHGYDVEEDFRD